MVVSRYVMHLLLPCKHEYMVLFGHLEGIKRILYGRLTLLNVCFPIDKWLEPLPWGLNLWYPLWLYFVYAHHNAQRRHMFASAVKLHPVESVMVYAGDLLCISYLRLASFWVRKGAQKDQTQKSWRAICFTCNTHPQNLGICTCLFQEWSCEGAGDPSDDMASGSTGRGSRAREKRPYTASIGPPAQPRIATRVALTARTTQNDVHALMLAHQQ